MPEPEPILWDQPIEAAAMGYHNDFLAPQGVAEMPIKKETPRVKGPIVLEKHTVEEVFRNREPNRLTQEFAEKFLEQQKDLIPSIPYVFKDSKSLVGIEVEVENVLHIDPNIPLGFWSIHEDGSLRNNGREFKTKPMPIKYVHSALIQLFRGLNNSIDFSRRTSIHVHMDVRHLTLSQLYGMVFTYAAVENILFKFAGEDRRKNIFCVPVTETLGLSSASADMLKFLYDIENWWSKYSACNMLPIKHFGTLEFRQMPGTNNVKKLLIWIDLLSQLKIYAYRFSRIDIVNQISKLNTNSQYQQFVKGVFGDLTNYLDTSDLMSDMEKPVYVIKNCAINNTFHKKVLNSSIEGCNFLLSLDPNRSLRNLSRTQVRCLKLLYKHLSSSRVKLADFYTAVVSSDLSSIPGSLHPYFNHLMSPKTAAAPKFPSSDEAW